MELFDDYSRLIKVTIHENKIAEHLRSITEQEQRIAFLKKQEEQRRDLLPKHEESLKKSRSELACKERELDECLRMMKKKEAHAKVVTSLQQAEAIEKEMSSLKATKEGLEETILELMSVVEDLAKEVQEGERFLIGVKVTIAEIEVEVNEQKAVFESAILENEVKINALLTECSNATRGLFLSTNKKYRFKHPLTAVKGQKCGHCFRVIPHEDIQHLDRGTSFRTCAGCGRILLPSALTDAELKG
ncbi:MAG: hypothetical protein HQK50_10450 [Oligoflexia bacterium]|nr:hypothetical protein [Oligoflexia bacterium]MBF0365982.1 hypothetical protein [Oligoflexia bacterium]